jgi:hypothetical protein
VNGVISVHVNLVVMYVEGSWANPSGQHRDRDGDGPCGNCRHRRGCAEHCCQHHCRYSVCSFSPRGYFHPAPALPPRPVSLIFLMLALFPHCSPTSMHALGHVHDRQAAVHACACTVHSVYSCQQHSRLLHCRTVPFRYTSGLQSSAQQDLHPCSTAVLCHPATPGGYRAASCAKCNQLCPAVSVICHLLVACIHPIAQFHQQACIGTTLIPRSRRACTCAVANSTPRCSTAAVPSRHSLGLHGRAQQHLHRFVPSAIIIGSLLHAHVLPTLL